MQEKYLVRGDLSDEDALRAVFVEEFRRRFKLTRSSSKELEP